MQIAENLAIIPYLLAVIGFLIVFVLNGIKGEIRDTKRAVQNLEVDLRGGLASLDRRVLVIEARCAHLREKED